MIGKSLYFEMLPGVKSGKCPNKGFFVCMEGRTQ